MTNSKSNTSLISDDVDNRAQNKMNSRASPKIGKNKTTLSTDQGYLPAFESKTATKALLKHIDIATYASLEQNGTIDDTPDNEKAITVLSKNKLGFMIDELDGFQLSSAVTRYIQHSTQTSRLRASSQTLSGLVEELESKIETYHMLKRRGSHDVDYFEGDIKEWVVHIIDELTQATLHFSYQVHNVLNIIVDLDVRIIENENAIKTIDKLNGVFQHLNVDKLSILTRGDAFLQPLLMRLLKSKLDQSISELIQAGHQLRQNLTQLQQDKRMQVLNEVVDDWYQHFTKNPTFVADISLLTHGQSCFNIAEPLSLITHADLDDPSHDAFIANFGEQIANQVKPLPSQTNDVSVDRDIATPVEDVSQTAIKDVAISPFYQAIEQFFEALTTADGLTELSGKQAWQTFFQSPENNNGSDVNESDVTLEDWLLGLVNHYYAYQSTFTPKLNLNFDEYTVPNYSGNKIVIDVVISHFNLVYQAHTQPRVRNSDDNTVS